MINIKNQNFVKLFICMLIILIMSCGTGPWLTTTRKFDLFKYPIMKENSSKILFDGAYIENSIIENPYRDIRYYIFYNNGYCLEGFINRKYWNSNPVKYNILTTDILKSNNELGVYNINSNHLRIDEFHSNKRLFLRWVVNRSVFILNDSVIYFNDTYVTPKSFSATNHYGEYKYYKLDSIPQVTQTWYIKKRWYKKNLHESRK